MLKKRFNVTVTFKVENLFTQAGSTPEEAREGAMIYLRNCILSDHNYEDFLLATLKDHCEITLEIQED